MKSKAFTLIETLVACAILIILSGALLGVSLWVNYDIAYVRNQAVAYNLAAEAIEISRLSSETNLIDSSSETTWNSLICNPSSGAVSVPDTSGKTVYSIDQNAGNCFGSPRLALETNPAGDKINLNGITYERKISFEKSDLRPMVESQTVSDQNSLQIVVNVSWSQSGRNQNIVLRELLTNWKQGI